MTDDKQEERISMIAGYSLRLKDLDKQKQKAKIKARKIVYEWVKENQINFRQFNELIKQIESNFCGW